MAWLGATLPFAVAEKTSTELGAVHSVTYMFPLLSTAMPSFPVNPVFEPEIMRVGATFPFEPAG